MKRSGFTMIELIFVIVILGILAAVAIPRLSATRDDAQVAAIATNVGTLISDATARFTASGELNVTTQAQWETATNVRDNVTFTANTATFNNGAATPVDCFTVVYNAAAGTLTTTDLASTDPICVGARGRMGLTSGGTQVATIRGNTVAF